ncbi:DUF7662 domain-containing protein [Phenylobacterium sp.]|uniref:DUF7662 domain-containing protein n=1 Tax=Phenylobacterium sp. TaxID=1871053 RepID=UPI003BA95915
MELKLARLQDFLRARYPAELHLSLKEIEEIICGRLPAPAARPRWWVGPLDPGQERHERAWREVGYAAAMSGLALIVTFRPQPNGPDERIIWRDLKEMVFPSDEKPSRDRSRSPWRDRPHRQRAH